MAKDNFETETDLIKWMNENKEMIGKFVSFWEKQNQKEDESETDEPSEEIEKLSMNVLALDKDPKLLKFPFYEGQGHLINNLRLHVFEDHNNGFEYFFIDENIPIVDTFLKSAYQCHVLKVIDFYSKTMVELFAFRTNQELFDFLTLAKTVGRFRLTIQHDQNMDKNFVLVAQFMNPPEHEHYTKIINEYVELSAPTPAISAQSNLEILGPVYARKSRKWCTNCQAELRQVDPLVFSCNHGVCESCRRSGVPFCDLTMQTKANDGNRLINEFGRPYYIYTTTCQVCKERVTFQKFED